MTEYHTSEDDRRNEFSLMVAILDQDVQAAAKLVFPGQRGIENILAAAMVIAGQLTPRQRDKLREIAIKRLRKMDSA
jgi:hypothetical protein